VEPTLAQWQVSTSEGLPTIQRELTCAGLAEAVWLVLKIGELAEEVGQLPTLLVRADGVTVTLRASAGDSMSVSRVRLLSGEQSDGNLRFY
jgi:pterin-4a-carbinolamine dehydratase